MALPTDYLERVYAGVLGKIIGVYLGRPFEGWDYDHILRDLGEVWYYVHEKRGVPLIVTDDDISGTFTFLRALPDYGNRRELTAAQIGQTWLNYLIEKKTILWWGGMGNSTEHTAYIRLKNGVPAPQSGSIAINGKVVAEQIGAQIFIDGWGMVAPGDPELAAQLARKAASVSHDGEALYGAQVVAAMEAQAFVESDINRLLDTAVSFIPKDSVLYRMIGDIRTWHSEEKDWRKTREKIAANYGYDRYGGNCHMVPNHALIIHALLHGEDNFQKSLMIVNTCGWDTDCNSGNVGCLMGLRFGLEGIENGPDWRGPVADRLYVCAADGGRCITDAVRETVEIVNIGRTLAGEDPVAPKNGARFHFTLPGSVQGFRQEDSIECRGVIRAVENEEGPAGEGQRRLAIRYHHLAAGRPARVATPTFIPPEAIKLGGYGLIASPTLYPGQTVRAKFFLQSDSHQPVTVRLYVRHYDAEDKLARLYGSEVTLDAAGEHELAWRIPETGGYPIAEVGIEITSEQRADGIVTLDYLTWDGAPDVTFKKPEGGTMWKRAWVEGVDRCDSWSEPYRLGQDYGTGLLIQGCREWEDYRVSATVTPHMVTSAGIAARVQGMKRYYAFLLCRDGKARLVRALDGDTVLAETDFPWQFGASYPLSFQVNGKLLRAGIGDTLLFTVQDADRPLTGGAIAVVCEEGRAAIDNIRVAPA
jgi:ADP-ribosylglycohydrolase